MRRVELAKLSAEDRALFSEMLDEERVGEAPVTSRRSWVIAALAGGTAVVGLVASLVPPTSRVTLAFELVGAMAALAGTVVAAWSVVRARALERAPFPCGDRLYPDGWIRVEPERAWLLDARDITSIDVSIVGRPVVRVNAGSWSSTERYVSLDVTALELARTDDGLEASRPAHAIRHAEAASYRMASRPIEAADVTFGEPAQPTDIRRGRGPVGLALAAAVAGLAIACAVAPMRLAEVVAPSAVCGGPSFAPLAFELAWGPFAPPIRQALEDRIAACEDTHGFDVAEPLRTGLTTLVLDRRLARLDTLAIRSACAPNGEVRALASVRAAMHGVAPIPYRDLEISPDRVAPRVREAFGLAAPASTREPSATLWLTCHFTALGDGDGEPGDIRIEAYWELVAEHAGHRLDERTASTTRDVHAGAVGVALAELEAAADAAILVPR